MFSASLTLFGYGLQIYVLTRIRPGFTGMSILTAIVLILLAVAVLATTGRRERLRYVAGGLSALPIAPVLLSYLLTGADTLSMPLAIRAFSVPPQEAGRTALATAVACLLLAIAILLRRSRPRTADLAAGLVAAISATGLLGYLYGVPDLYAFWVFNTMAVHTAVSLLLLAVAVIFSVPGVGWSGLITSPTAGGRATRRQLSVLLIPPAFMRPTSTSWAPAPPWHSWASRWFGPLRC